MAQENDILKYLLIGVGAYLVWEYVIAPMMAQQTTAATGTGAQPIVVGGSSTPIQSPVQTGTQTGASVPSSPGVTAAQLQQMAGTALLNPDQWSYYYQQIPGKTVSPQQMEVILGKLGLTDATRATNITSTQFVNALNQAGLSGIVPSWPSSGGPAFSNFIPSGGGGLSGGFSSYNRGFRAAPKGYLQ